MSVSEKIYTSLCILFSSLLILGNLTYQKFITLPFIWPLELSVGAILYPLTFLITDLITELYGKEKAIFCVRMAIATNILVAIILIFMDYLPATNWSKIDDSIFHQVFGFYSVAFIGSLIACYIAQAIDIQIYLWIRKLTGIKNLWLRTAGSTAISLAIDTAIVVSCLTIFKILPTEQILVLILNSYAWKLCFTICGIPLFYACVNGIKSCRI